MSPGTNTLWIALKTAQTLFHSHNVIFYPD